MMNRENESDIAVTTRVRIARNIKRLAYPKKQTADGAQKIIEDVWAALNRSELGKELTLYETKNMSERLKQSLIERHLISAELAASPVPSAAAISRDRTVSVMINEEDHLRIQVFVPGLDPGAAYDKAKKLEAIINESLPFDCDGEFGYLTACPTNIGTGLRASVMLHLPAISVSHSVNELLSWAANLGMTVRGLYGEGSKASGAFFQLSNRITLGVSEEEIISRFSAAVCGLISEERRISAALFEQDGIELRDKCMRSLGILKYACTLSSSEAADLISYVCLGANSGIIKNIHTAALRNAFFDTLPATLALSEGELSEEELGMKRAQFLQNILSAKEE